ncbi:MAG TPA: MBL fold metallo-hydrolase [Bacillota bacterium]|nr:MBL fold metallo-hydrolase [Bacillota bacterium]
MKRIKPDKTFFLFLAFALVFTVFTGCVSTRTPENVQPSVQAEPPYTAELFQKTDTLRVHFLDVGQGDSILVQFPNSKNMLVDAGPPEAANRIINYLRNNGVSTVNYLVATHPHADHIGSMPAVIKSFPAGEVFMPGVTTNTQIFRDLLAAIKSEGLQITKAKAGVVILEEGNLSAFFLAPCKDSYESLNNYSAVIKIEWGDTAFLLTGDAEEQSEFEMLVSNVETPKADVLKVGHHGSQSSTSVAFLGAVSPKYAVISAAKNNDYNHPHRETIEKLDKAGITTLRTDKSGTVVFAADESGTIIYTTRQ